MATLVQGPGWDQLQGEGNNRPSARAAARESDPVQRINK